MKLRKRHHKLFKSCLHLFVIIILFIVINGCSHKKVRNAFEGKIASIEGNKIISEYCQSCHTHRDLEPNEHVIKNANSYTMETFKRARECRACHSIKVNFWEEVSHITKYPSMVGG